MPIVAAVRYRAGLLKNNGSRLKAISVNPFCNARCQLLSTTARPGHEGRLSGLRNAPDNTTRPQSTVASPLDQPVVIPRMKDVILKFLEQKESIAGYDEDRRQRPMERIRNFPAGVKGVLRDCFRYKAILDTPLASWKIDIPLVEHDGHGSNEVSSNRAVQKYIGRIPRKEYEQQRQLQNDFRTMIPLVIVWIPPIIGFIPPILAIMAPRQVMSRHFHNPFEIESFAQIEYQQRQKAYLDLADMFWCSFRSTSSVRETMAKCLPLKGIASDNAGPILDALSLYKTTFEVDEKRFKGKNSTSVVPEGMYSSIRGLPREYLVKLALAIGINQYLPGWLSTWVTEFQPTIWLQSQVDRIARVICYDDAILLEEGHHLNHCAFLSDLEVMDACLVRGLPITSRNSAKERRMFLTNHLRMIASVREKVPASRLSGDGFRLFTLHLAPLRYHLKELYNR